MTEVEVGVVTEAVKEAGTAAEAGTEVEAEIGTEVETAEENDSQE